MSKNITHYHETADGKFIKLTDLADSHLDNIIKMIERKAQEGITVGSGGGHGDMEEMWYDVEELEGEEVLYHFGYHRYINERKRRNNLKTPMP
jgi:UDP-glucose 4-epimerase